MAMIIALWCIQSLGAFPEGYTTNINQYKHSIQAHLKIYMFSHFYVLSHNRLILPLPSSHIQKVHNHVCGTLSLPSAWGQGGHKLPCSEEVRSGRGEPPVMLRQS